MLNTLPLEARVTFTPRRLIKPLRLSSGAITEVTEARADVTVRIGERVATGSGAVYLSDLWAWPTEAVPHAERDARMRRVCEEIAADLPVLCGGEEAHPLELGLRLHHALSGADAPEEPPALARLVCLSPFDAALHDAAGQALGRSAFTFYEEPTPLPTADSWFADRDACQAIAHMFRTPPKALDAWLVVGQDDTAEEIGPWVRGRGYRAFKLKLLGKDAAADAVRTIEIFQIARSLGAKAPRLAVDSNCANPDADSVLDYLDRLRTEAPEAYDALEYLEQPTGRDIHRHAFDWRAVAAHRPVLLDEGLTSLERLALAEDQGWSGIAVKTCRGHSFALVAAARAHERGMLLAAQDLTNPNIAAIHSALLAAHLPVFNGIELNSPQYTPEANAEYLPRLRTLFEPTDGQHFVPDTTSNGLGSRL